MEDRVGGVGQEGGEMRKALQRFSPLGLRDASLAMYSLLNNLFP
jgi:hypothetical protein